MELKREKPRTGWVHFIKKVCLGLVVGIASITPGLSGGVIAAAAGLYEPAIYAMVSIRKQFRKSVAYLFPLGLGVAIGILLFSRVMQALMLKAEFLILYIFLGLVVGTLPALVKQANNRGFRKRYLWTAVIAFASVLYVERMLAWAPNQAGNMELTAFNTILCGVVLAVGTIIPGISSSFILMYMGVYERLLNAIVTFDIGILILLTVGFAITALIMIKLVNVVFCKFRGFAYYAVLGFLLGSMVMVFPGLRTGWGLVLDLFLFLSSAALSFSIMRLNKKEP